MTNGEPLWYYFISRYGRQETMTRFRMGPVPLTGKRSPVAANHETKRDLRRWKAETLKTERRKVTERLRYACNIRFVRTSITPNSVI